jgi:hypothetical protein
MHIAFQRSGGRGEYEVVGSQAGFTAFSLDGWTFNLQWPDGLVRETGLGVDPATSGKPRLRSILDEKFQIGRMVAAMCMLPDPRREYAGTGTSLPLIENKKFVLSRLGFGPETEFSPHIDLVTIEPAFITLEDAAEVVTIGINSRWDRVTRVYSSISSLPTALQGPVTQHRDFMASGTTVTKALTSIVALIGRVLAQQDARHVAGLDPLPSLERLLELPAVEGPTLPPPDRLGDDEPEASARSAFEYRMAKMRDAKSRQFSLAVRAAYHNRCAFCGYVFGGVQGIRSGVDAAHILAWSSHDLDVVTNGLSLCKLHHWAFDEALVMPVALGAGAYSLRLTTLAEQFPTETRTRLVAEDGLVLPAEWLPADKSQRPSKKYLEKLYADLAVTFAA